MSSDYRNVYRTTFSRAMHSLVCNGFFARELDADDVAFIDQVRERGTVACGSLAYPTVTSPDFDLHCHEALDEELSYWASPFEEERGIVRRMVRRPPPLTAAEQRARLLIRQERARDRQLMADALAEEQAAWNRKQIEARQERDRQLMRQMESDAAWDAEERQRRQQHDLEKTSLRESEIIGQVAKEIGAKTPAPLDVFRANQAKKQRRVARYYKSMGDDWRRYGRGEKGVERKREAELHQQRLEQQRLDREAARKAEAEAKRKAELEAQRVANEQLAEQRKREAEQVAKQAKAVEHKRVDEQPMWTARKTKDAAENFDRWMAANKINPHVPWPDPPVRGRMVVFDEINVLVHDTDIGMLMMSYSEQLRFIEQRGTLRRFVTVNGEPFNPERRDRAAALKRDILRTIRGTGSQIWTVEDLMRATGCTDRTKVIHAAGVLSAAGCLHQNGTPV